jgi:hypothetical protein
MHGPMNNELLKYILYTSKSSIFCLVTRLQAGQSGFKSQQEEERDRLEQQIKYTTTRWGIRVQCPESTQIRPYPHRYVFILPGLCLMGTQGTCIYRCWSIKLNIYLLTVLNKPHCMVYYLRTPLCLHSIQHNWRIIFKSVVCLHNI